MVMIAYLGYFSLSATHIWGVFPISFVSDGWVYLDECRGNGHPNDCMSNPPGHQDGQISDFPIYNDLTRPKNPKLVV